ncbi:hypothetical protein BJ742DRAFT_838174 [Cladochytrium replicatum]|nr:hypothetical protein BJ742DRAFT_838174 [Cladochytrium replicatum]
MAGGNPYEPYHVFGRQVPRYKVALYVMAFYGVGITAIIQYNKAKPIPAVTYESKAEESFVKKYIAHAHRDSHKPALARTNYTGQ